MDVAVSMVSGSATCTWQLVASDGDDTIESFQFTTKSMQCNKKNLKLSKP